MAAKQSAFTTSHFFKVLMHGFQQKQAVEKFKPETTILESRLGIWKVGMSKDCDNDLICFKQGWPEFVERHALEISTTQHLHFTVSVFDSSMCEKEFSAPIPPYRRGSGGNPLFLEDDSANCGHSNNLGKQRVAVLRDCEGKTWKVSVDSAGNDGCRQRLRFLRIQRPQGWRYLHFQTHSIRANMHHYLLRCAH